MEVKWGGKLSTTSTNNVGLIKVRQNNAETFEFQITQNSTPYDLSGLKVYFCTSFEPTKIVQKATTVTNAKQGVIQFTMDDDAMHEVGRQKAYFEIQKSSEVIDATQNFEYQIQDSILKRDMNSESYIQQFEDVLNTLGDDAAYNLAKEVNNLQFEKADRVPTENALEFLQTNKASHVDVDTKLAAIVNGAPKGTFNTLSDLEKAYPKGTEGVFLVLSNGHWYYWNSSLNSWKDGGVYQGVEPRDYSITPIKTTFISSTYNLFNWKSASINAFVKNDGTLGYDPNFVVSDYIKTTFDEDYSTINVVNVARFDSDRKIINITSSDKFNSNAAAYVRLTIKKENLKTSQINKGTLLPFVLGENKLSREVTVTKENLGLSDNDISFSEKTKIGLKVSLILTGKLPDISREARTITFFKGTIFLYGTKSYLLPDDVKLSLTSHHHYVFFDYLRMELRAYSALSSLSNIPESNMLVSTISFTGSESKNLMTVELPCDYTVDGEKVQKLSKSEVLSYVSNANSKNNVYTEPIPTDWYKSTPVDGYAADNHYVDTITFDDVYATYDAVSLAEPDWCTKTELGMDSSGLYPIFRYDFNPEQVPSTLAPLKIPKIIVVTNTHGEEKSSTLAVRNAIEKIANEWRSDPVLEFLRFNVHLIVVPIVNPWGFQNHKRKNSNGVDINRNASYRWAQANSNPDSNEYKGPSPFSEKEAQYIKAIVDQNEDAITFYDYHMNGTSGDDYLTMFWHLIEDFRDDGHFEALNDFSKKNISKLTRESQKRYGVSNTSGMIGYISYNDNRSTLAGYAYSKKIPGLTLECTKKLVGENKVYSAKSLQLSTEFFVNSLMNNVRSFLN